MEGIKVQFATQVSAIAETRADHQGDKFNELLDARRPSALSAIADGCRCSARAVGPVPPGGLIRAYDAAWSSHASTRRRTSRDAQLQVGRKPANDPACSSTRHGLPAPGAERRRPGPHAWRYQITGARKRARSSRTAPWLYRPQDIFFRSSWHRRRPPLAGRAPSASRFIVRIRFDPQGLAHGLRRVLVLPGEKRRGEVRDSHRQLFTPAPREAEPPSATPTPLQHCFTVRVAERRLHDQIEGIPMRSYLLSPDFPSSPAWKHPRGPHGTQDITKLSRRRRAADPERLLPAGCGPRSGRISRGRTINEMVAGSRLRRHGRFLSGTFSSTGFRRCRQCKRAVSISVLSGSNRQRQCQENRVAGLGQTISCVCCLHRPWCCCAQAAQAGTQRDDRHRTSRRKCRFGS